MPEDIYSRIFQDEDEFKARVNVIQDRNPADAAKARRLSRVVNQPPGVIEGAIPQFEVEAIRRQTDAAIRSDPWLARFFSNPDNAAIAKGDAPRLAAVGSVLEPWTRGQQQKFLDEVLGPTNNLGEVSRRAVSMLTGSAPPPPRMTWAPSRELGDLQRSPTRSLSAVDVVETAMDVRAPLGGGVDWSLRRGVKGAASVFGEAGLRTLQGLYGIQQFKSDVAGDVLGSAAAVEGKKVAERGTKAIRPVFLNRVQESAYEGLVSAGQMAMFAPAGGTGVLAGLTGTVSGEAYGRYRGRGASIAMAATGGLAEGAIELVTEKWLGSLGFLFGGFGKDSAKSFVKGLLGASGRELIGENVATVLQDAVDTAIANPDKSWEEYWAERPDRAIDTSISTATMMGVMGGARGIAGRLGPEKRALDDMATGLAGQKLLDDLMAEAEDSKVRKLDPDSFSEFVNDRTDGTPIQHVYIPIEAVETYLQSEGADPEFFEPYVDQIEEARRLQGDIVVPIGEAMARLAGTPTWQALREEVRVTPGGMSGKEAREKAKTFMQELEARGAQIAEEAMAEGEAMAPAAEVYTQVRAELMAIGRGEREAGAIAQLVAARREAAGIRLGMTAAEYHAANPIRFREAEPGEEPGENAMLNVALETVTSEQVSAALSEIGVALQSSTIGQSDTAPTLVARIDRPLTKRENTKLSKTLGQVTQAVGDAIPEGFLTESDARRSDVMAADGEIEDHSGRRDLFQTGEGEVFYSALERAVEATSTTRAPAAQWIATLRKAPGVKQEELEWSGVLDFLDMQEGPVERERLLELLRGGGIVVDEIVLSGADEEQVQQEATRRANSVADREDEGAWDEAYQTALDDLSETQATQFASWSSDPNNDTYRELLLTLPIGRGKNPARAPSTHWDVESVVAHARFMEKTDAEGKRVLFIEEVQSDWHQKGRDEGYEQPVDPETVKLASERLETVKTKVEAVDKGLKKRAVELGFKTATEDEELKTILAQRFITGIQNKEKAGSDLAIELLDLRESFGRARLELDEAKQGYSNAIQVQGIPNAPFKSSWPALVMKRMIRWAADNGFERIAWTTGEEQAERYNLSQAVGEILAGPIEKDGTRLVLLKPDALRVLTENGMGVREGPQLRMTDAQIKEAFGEAIAHRMREKPGEVELRDDDLRVGGEGMKAFYDRNLVNIVNDIIKKHGVKVGTVDFVYAGSKGGALVQGLHPGFDITEQLAAAAQSGFALFQKDKGRTVRGQAQFGNDPGAVITLFETANLSTLVHELGHVFLEEMFRDASRKDAPTELKEDVAKIRNWFAVNGHAVRRGQIPTAAHELFARGWERYAMEGKAPAVALRGAFKQFRAWLLRIYEVVSNLNAPITPEVREVFDRMLATQDAIDLNQDTQAPFADQVQARMTDAEWAAYTKSIANARDEAYDALLFKTMAAIRRREEARIRDQRANVRADVAADINSRPEFVALHLLRTGRWLGEPDRPPTPVKLNSGWLLDNYGDDIVSRLPRGLPIIRADGLDGDTVAEMVGLASGDQLVKTLIAMREASDRLRLSGEKRGVRDMLVDQETDRVMAERHGDTMTDGSIEEEAIAAINSARQGEIIAGEMRQLTKRNASLGGPTPYQIAREWAKRTVIAGRVVDVASRAAVQRYIRATQKAARGFEKAILADDVDEAFRQKQAQLLNHALLAESKAAADEIDTIVARMKRIAGQKARRSVDQAYFDRIHELLERFDFRPRSQRSLDEQSNFDDWAARQRDKGFEVHIPARLAGVAEHYSRVSVETLYELNDAVQSLLALGKTKQKIRDALGERDLLEFIDELVASVGLLPDRKLPATVTEKEKRPGAWAASELLKVETIADELDRGDPNGPANRLLVRGASTAAIRRDALGEEVLVPIAKLFNAMPKKHRKSMRDKITAERLTWNTLNEGDTRLGQPVTMTRMEWIGVAVNTGNLSNFEKMVKGEGWSPVQVPIELNNILTKDDWDFVNGLWRAVEKLWPHIVEVERELSGVVPEEVTPLDVETPFGTYKGAYWPVVYDVARSQRAENNADDAANDLFGAKSGIGTPKGHTIARTEATGPLTYRVEEVLVNHVERVTTRIAYATWVRDVVRIIDNPRVRGIIDTKLGPEYRKQIKPWLRRQISANAIDRRGSAWWNTAMRQFRINLSISAMGFAYSTGVAQTLGLAFSAGRIGAINVALGLKHLLHPIRGFGKAQDFVFSRSPEMERRGQELNREVVEVFQQLRGTHGWYTNAQAMAFWHIAMIDRYMVAMPTWLGAHQKAMKEGMTDEEASRYADKIVRNSQGSGREKDLAAVQSSNHEAWQFFVMFYTPFNVQFNAQWDSVRAAKSGDWRRSLQITTWFLLATTLADALMSGDWPEDEDEDGIGFDELFGWFGRNVFFGLFGGIPLARDGSSFVERKLRGEFADPEVPPFALIERGYRAVDQTYDVAFEDKEVTGAYIKSMSSTIGAAFGLPGGQFGKTGGFLWDTSTGEVDPDSVRDWYTGLTSGKVAEEE